MTDNCNKILDAKSNINKTWITKFKMGNYLFQYKVANLIKIYFNILLAVQFTVGYHIIFDKNFKSLDFYINANHIYKQTLYESYNMLHNLHVSISTKPFFSIKLIFLTFC